MEQSKNRLKDPKGKQRSHITKFIVQSKSRQEFLPLLGKYVDLLKAEPLHHTSFASRLTTNHHQALKNRKQRGTFWKIRDCCCFLEMSLVCVLHYNRECSWKPVLPSIVCVFHSHMDSHGLNQSTFAGILPLSYRNFCRSTIFQGVRCETSHLSICCSQIQRCSFYLLKSWGAHWASGKAKDLIPTHTRKFNIWCLGLNSMQGREAKHVKLA